jgi:hypothetical protein
LLTDKVATVGPYLHLIARGMKKACELPVLFFGGFHHQHRIEGLFAAMRHIDSGNLLPETLMAKSGMAANRVAPAASATMDKAQRTNQGAAGAVAALPLKKGNQSKAQTSTYVTALGNTAKAVEEHRQSLGDGPLPPAPPCGDIGEAFDIGT